MVTFAPSTTADEFYISGWFRSGLDEEKELKTERKRKVVNVNGDDYDVEEIYATIDSAKEIRYIQPLSDVVAFIKENASEELAKQAFLYIDEINKRLTPFKEFGFPPFSASLPENDTLLIEWGFRHFTIGMFFDPNPEESSYYIVNDGKTRKTTAWGYLDSQSINENVGQFIHEGIGGLSDAGD